MGDLECKWEYRKHDGNACEGKIDYRINPYTWTAWGVMCDRHFEQRFDMEQDANDRYGIHSDVRPSWVDESYAGERWEEDY